MLPCLRLCLHVHIIFQTVGFVLHLGVAGGYPVDPVAGKKQFFMGTSLNEVTQLLLELGRRKASKEMGHLSLHYWRVGDQGASRIVEMPVVI